MISRPYKFSHCMSFEARVSIDFASLTALYATLTPKSNIPWWRIHSPNRVLFALATLETELEVWGVKPHRPKNSLIMLWQQKYNT